MAEPKGSASGICFLLFLVFFGPFVYLCRHWYREHTGFYEEEAQKTAGGLASQKEDLSAQSTVSETDDEEARDPIPAGKTPTSGVSEEEREEVPYYEYLFGLIGYAIGIGNVWRFPYLVGRYGGGAFVVAYLICLCFCALPMFLMELGIGQHVRKSSLMAFEIIRPRWKPLGIAQFIGSTLIVASYYNVLLCYALLYIFASCEEPLPWEKNGAQSYWTYTVLNQYGDAEGKSGLGPVSWKIASCLIVIYIIVYLSVAFGKETLAKVTWVTVMMPVLLITILLFKAVTLPGAGAGIDFYLGKFDASELYNGELWSAACGQILFSLSPGTGTAMTLTSLSKKNTDVYKAALTVGLTNSAFSLFAGFAVFGVLGNLAKNMNVPVAEVATASGMGLAFIAIAEGMTHFGKFANLMSVLFFSMLLFLGFDSTFAMVETAVAMTTDLMKKHNLYDKLQLNHMKMTLALCIFLFLIGLPYTCRSGGLLMDVIDHFIGSYFLLMSCAMEAIMFRLDFGWERYALSVKMATMGNPDTPEGRVVWPEAFWTFTFNYSAPFLCTVLFFFGMIFDIVTGYGKGSIPLSIVAIGWTLFALAMALSVCNLHDKSPSAMKVLDANSPTGFVAAEPGVNVAGPAAIPKPMVEL